MRVAIFDFDGTLYAGETFQLLMDHLKNHPVHHPKFKKFFRTILRPYIGHKIKLVSEAKMKEQSMQIYLDALGDQSVNELNQYFDELTAKVRQDFNPEVLSRLEQHIADDVFVMLVSGAYTPLLHSVTKELHFDTIIGTEVPIKGQDIDLQAPIFHVHGQRKNEKIEHSLKGREIDWENSFAYGDSFSDLSVLELVGHPVAVRPEPRLQDIAQQRGWDII